MDLRFESVEVLHPAQRADDDAAIELLMPDRENPRDAQALGQQDFVGGKAFDQQGRIEFDVALLDMQMPGMDGLTLARALRAVDGLAGLPCVLLTSVGQYASREEVLAAGIGTQITKPVRHMALRHVLLDLFSDADADATRDRVAGSRPALRPARILIAEDNRVNQRVATRMLERLGFRPDAVANGLEAVAACKRVPYDLVLMDCQMPEMDGYEATRRIRAGRVRGEPVIVALTANAMKGDAERCRESGMHDYLAKPVTLPALVATLERWLAAKPAAAPVAGIDGSP
jgi:CheY-like chemotaxis protein